MKTLINHFILMYKYIEWLGNTMVKEQNYKKHFIPYERVFRPDPNEVKEDERPVEVRKKFVPDHSIPWEAIGEE